MSRKQTLLRGTFILTAVGLITRIMGFFYRIFLSRTFHAEGVGLYQLIFPVYSLCFSLTAAGIQVALSRIIAGHAALHKEKESVLSLRAALMFTTLLSLIVMLILQRYAENTAVYFLRESRCDVLLIAMSYAFPFAAIHSCVCGYYLGLKQVRIPALSQLYEQAARIGSVWLFYKIGLHYSHDTHILIAVFGLVCGEFVAAVSSMYTLRRTLHPYPAALCEYISPALSLFRLSAPLTANRVLLNILQSVEAISIPQQLQAHGLSVSEALSTYGVLTGMALPCILFPSAITNSVSTMLLPTVAEIQTAGSKKTMKSMIQKVSFSCFALGFACMISFFVMGNFIGKIIFHNMEAGKFIMILAFICPFLYTNTALISILNGLGKTGTTFVINMLGLSLRIASIFIFICRFGIRGYLWGLLASQLLVSLLSLAALLRQQ